MEHFFVGLAVVIDLFYTVIVVGKGLSRLSTTMLILLDYGDGGQIGSSDGSSSGSLLLMFDENDGAGSWLHLFDRSEGDHGR
jgi:hypothetical protein